MDGIYEKFVRSRIAAILPIAGLVSVTAGTVVTDIVAMVYNSGDIDPGSVETLSYTLGLTASALVLGGLVVVIAGTFIVWPIVLRARGLGRSIWRLYWVTAIALLVYLLSSYGFDINLTVEELTEQQEFIQRLRAVRILCMFTFVFFSMWLTRQLIIRKNK